MKALSQAVLVLVIAVNFLVAGTAIPASAKVCPCCAKADADDNGAAHVKAPMGCCKMKGAAPSESVTLNTGVEDSNNILTVSLDETAPSYTPVMREVPRPDYGRWAFESPPIYKLIATYLC